MGNNYILWIEDDSIFLENTIPLFEKEGLYVEGVSDVRKSIEKIKKDYFKYSLLLLDLQILENDDFKIYNEIKKANSHIPIIIVSGYFDDQEWISKLSSFDIKVDSIEKPVPMVASKDFFDIIELIKVKQENYITSRINPFEYSFDEFIRLDDEKKDAALEIAFEANSYYIKKYFNENPDKDWIVIAKRPGNIIKYGKFENEPFEEDLEKLAKKNKLPVFTYSRKKAIEQIDSGWNCVLAPYDYYPTVLLNFDSGDEQFILEGDFDTGSSHSYISYEELMNRGILKEKPLFQASSAVIWGHKYTYYRKRLKCKLLGNSKEKEIELKCEIVKDWKNSPQVSSYKNRVALIGRDLLLDNKIKLILDGENKKTDILI
ncbi:MAG: response regulator [Candidatus Thorarchaeota archaeon]